jgi:hypothetical protein
MILEDQKIQEAVIHFKNGSRKYGMLLPEKEVNDIYHFVSNTNYHHFNETGDKAYIEIVPGVLIDAIDTDLK